MNENQSNQGPKQKIVEKLLGSSNILVTVSKNPSVDELAAALGLTLMLDELNKHPTAVVSGQIPAAISFLDPAKTFENTVDSLRDFIIALDKEKADHLRYKVEGDVVKIFITPYKTTISESDLEFSQGDYNVELVLALGVDSQDNLDAALSAHGKIFHDATVASLSVGDEKSKLGTINWHESGASSISEMLVSLSEALKSDKTLLTEQVATAFLTGIVAATDRFSNSKTSSKVMTMAAQLMAAGANQQLIAAKLEESDAISKESSDTQNDTDSQESDDDADDTSNEEEKQSEAKPAAGTLSISHEKKGDLDEVAKQTQAEDQADAFEEAEESLAKKLEEVAPATVAAPSINEEIIEESKDEAPAEEPSLGGTLNATTEEAAEAKRLDEAADRNKTILTHGQAGGYMDQPSGPQFTAPLNASMQPDRSEPPSVDIFKEETPDVSTQAPIVMPPISDQPSPQVADTAVTQLPPIPEPSSNVPAETLADLDRKNRSDMHADAQAAVAAAFAEPAVASPSDSAEAPVLPPLPTLMPEQQPASPVAPAGLPPLPDFSKMPEPALPPLPQFGPPSGAIPPEQLGQIFTSPQAQPQVPQPSTVPSDPNQFKIPGQ